MEVFLVFFYYLMCFNGCLFLIVGFVIELEFFGFEGCLSGGDVREGFWLKIRIRYLCKMK